MSILGISEVAELASKTIDRVWPDKTEAEKQQLAAMVQMVTSQFEVNKTEAASPDRFVSGWRPFIGWVCGAAWAYTFLLYPLLTWACAAFAPHIVPPILGNNQMLNELLIGMLGLGGLRTFEKIKKAD